MLAMKTRTIEETPAMTRLQRTLLENQIPILDNEEVEAYKAKALWWYKAKAILLTWAAASLLCFLFAWSTLAALRLGSVWLPAVPVSLLLLGTVYVAVVITKEYCSGLLAAWNTCDFRWYLASERPVPDAVKQVAEQIYLGNLQVDWLGPDPFLWVSDPEDDFVRYYLMVWDEKGFFPHAVSVSK
jgi:hypothetical protein